MILLSSLQPSPYPYIAGGKARESGLPRDFLAQVCDIFQTKDFLLVCSSVHSSRSLDIQCGRRAFEATQVLVYGDVGWETDKHKCAVYAHTSWILFSQGPKEEGIVSPGRDTLGSPMPV